MPSAELEQKRLEILAEAVPQIQRVGALVNKLTAKAYDEGLKAAAGKLRTELRIERVSAAGDIRAAITTLKNGGADVLLVMDEPVLAGAVQDIAALALTMKLPSMCGSSGFAETGGWLHYGPSIPAMFRRAANHVDKILRGARPGDVPLELPSDFDLIVNLRTAKALGVTIAPSVQVRAVRAGAGKPPDRVSGAGFTNERADPVSYRA